MRKAVSQIWQEHKPGYRLGPGRLKMASPTVRRCDLEQGRSRDLQAVQMVVVVVELVVWFGTLCPGGASGVGDLIRGEAMRAGASLGHLRFQADCSLAENCLMKYEAEVV